MAVTHTNGKQQISATQQSQEQKSLRCIYVSSSRISWSDAPQVAYNVADSGVQPVRLDELVRGPEALQQLLSTELHYPAVGGPPALRRLIADWQGAAPDDILVT